MKTRVFSPQGLQIGWYEFEGDEFDHSVLRYRPAKFDLYAPFQWSLTARDGEFLIDGALGLPHTDPRFTALSVRSVDIKEAKQ